MKEPVPTAVRTSEIERSGRTGRRIVRGAMLIVASSALTGTVFLALRGFWDEAITTGFVSALFVWQFWRRSEAPAMSLSRRLSHRHASDPGETE